MKISIIIDTDKINHPFNIVREINKISFDKEILLLSRNDLDLGTSKEEKAGILRFDNIIYPEAMKKAIQESTGDILLIADPAINPRSEDFFKVISAYLSRKSDIFIAYSKPKDFFGMTKKILFSILYDRYMLDPFCDYLLLPKKLAENIRLTTALPVIEMAVKLIKRGYNIQGFRLGTAPLRKKRKTDLFQVISLLFKMRFYD
jgi:hypothetical protein